MIQLIWNNLTVALKSPELGNSEGARIDTTIRRSMNGTPYSFVSPNNKRILNYNFQKLSRRQVRAFYDFMATSHGKNVSLTDHENVKWFGTITTVPLASSHQGINRSDLSFTFEGVKVE